MWGETSGKNMQDICSVITIIDIHNDRELELASSFSSSRWFSETEGWNPCRLITTRFKGHRKETVSQSNLPSFFIHVLFPFSIFHFPCLHSLGDEFIILLSVSLCRFGDICFRWPSSLDVTLMSRRDSFCLPRLRHRVKEDSTSKCLSLRLCRARRSSLFFRLFFSHTVLHDEVLAWSCLFYFILYYSTLHWFETMWEV